MKAKKYSRRLQTVIGGNLLKAFDNDCAINQMNESEGIREALRLKYQHDLYGRKDANKRKMEGE